jgi:F-type H+-transporting ATPase subunit epsilon
MAAAPLHLELVAPDSAPIALDAARIVIPGAAGIFTVLPEHTPLLTTLTHGAVIAYKPNGEKQFFAVHQGFAEVAGDRVTILADGLEPAEQIDTMRAQEALGRARERLEKREPRVDIARAETALARALARLKARSQEEY